MMTGLDYQEAAWGKRTSSSGLGSRPQTWGSYISEEQGSYQSQSVLGKRIARFDLIDHLEQIFFNPWKTVLFVLFLFGTEVVPEIP